MLKKNKTKSISEKISETFINTSNEMDYESESESVAKVELIAEDDYNSIDVAYQPSEIRKQNIQLLSTHSSKYHGEVSCRDDVFNSTFGNSIAACCSNSDNGEDDRSYICEDNIVDSFIHNTEHSNDIIVAKNPTLQKEKGLCVRNQLYIWEKLLEIRIHSQKLINKANSLPCPVDFSKLSMQAKMLALTKETKQNVTFLLEKLLETQECLANGFSDTKKLKMFAKNSRLKSPSEYAHLMNKNFNIFKPYRNSVLTKWEDRTNLTSIGKTKQTSLAVSNDVVKKIDSCLVKKNDNISRSQKIKGNYVLFGQKPANLKQQNQSQGVVSPHVYDDTDFYHSQLRELIEFKSNMSINAYDDSIQFTELQKLRQKMKKKVDTRASKGRKIRYVLHHKIVNFMAPKDITEWTEESKNELYKSLFAT